MGNEGWPLISSTSGEDNDLREIPDRRQQLPARIGMFFGIYPATRSARLHPVEALRHE